MFTIFNITLKAGRSGKKSGTIGRVLPPMNITKVTTQMTNFITGGFLDINRVSKLNGSIVFRFKDTRPC